MRLSDYVAMGANVLDLPGSMARDLAVLRNPFDQWLTPFSGENRSSGRDVLETWSRPFGGGIGPNRPGLDAGDVGGLALELLLDPLNLLGGVGAAKIGKWLARAKSVAKANRQSKLARTLGAIPAEILAQSKIKDKLYSSGFGGGLEAGKAFYTTPEASEKIFRTWPVVQSMPPADMLPPFARGRTRTVTGPDYNAYTMMGYADIRKPFISSKMYDPHAIATGITDPALREKFSRAIYKTEATPNVYKYGTGTETGLKSGYEIGDELSHVDEMGFREHLENLGFDAYVDPASGLVLNWSGDIYAPHVAAKLLPRPQTSAMWGALTGMGLPAGAHAGRIAGFQSD